MNYIKEYFGGQSDWLIAMDNDGELKRIYKSLFLSESTIADFFEWDKEYLKERLERAKRFCDMPVKDVDDFLQQLRSPDFLRLEHSSPWEFLTIPVLNYTGAVRDFGCCRAKFDITNKWGHKQPHCYSQILYNADQLVLWIGDVLINRPVFWLSVDTAVYSLIYSHKRLEFAPSVCREPESVKGLSPETLDTVVKKYHTHLGSSVFEYANAVRIDLDPHFQKGFFYKGPKWNYGEYEDGKGWSPGAWHKKLSEIRDIQAENGLFKIKIENQTYPHYGYAYLDLKNLEIVDLS